MPTVEAIAKKDLLPAFKKGDKVTVVPILYEEDTVLHEDIYGWFNKNGQRVNPGEQKRGEELEKILIFSKAVAPKGSYKDSLIITNGKTYPSSLVKNYNDWFEKVK